MELRELDLPALRRWLVAAGASLTRHADALNRLNVFPVADADTGTNLAATLRDAIRAVADSPSHALPEASAELARACLVSARGNSGVILGRLVQGLADVVEADRLTTVDAAALARALEAAARLARDGVADPKPGTILTVAQAAADGTKADGSLAEASASAVRSADAALRATPTQLAALGRAGVVDAGGAGYLLVLQALDRVVRGRAGLVERDGPPDWLTAVPHLDPAAQGGGPAYEVMYLLADSDAGRVDALRQRLTEVGDSVVVAGGPALWSAHVHTDDVAAALEAGADAGRPYRFAVTRFADQDAAHGSVEGQRPDAHALVVVTSAPGMAALAEGAGARVVAADQQDASARVAEAVAAGSGVVLTDGPPAQAVVDAADLSPSVQRAGEHPAQLVALLDVLDPGAGAEQTRDCLARTLQDLRTDWTSGGVEEALATVERLVDDETELITLVSGVDATEQGEALAAALRRAHPDHEVVLVPDGCESGVAVGVE